MTIDEFINKYLYDSEYDGEIYSADDGKTETKGSYKVVRKSKEIGIDFDKADGRQCVDVYKQFCHDVVGIEKIGQTGNAKYISSDFGSEERTKKALFNQKDYFIKITDRYQLKKGDVLVWEYAPGKAYSDTGHVAIMSRDIVYEGNKPYIYSIEQDGRFPNTTFVHERRRELNGNYVPDAGLRLKNGQASDSGDYIINDKEYQEFTQLMTLPEKLGNLNYDDDDPLGLGKWFTREALVGYMYQSGYKKINGQYVNLVRLFDEQMIKGNDKTEGHSPITTKEHGTAIIPTGCDYFIDNVMDEKSDDLCFDYKELQNFFTNKEMTRESGASTNGYPRHYLFGGEKNSDGETTLATNVFVRYGGKLGGIDSMYRRLILIPQSQKDKQVKQTEEYSPNGKVKLSSRLDRTGIVYRYIFCGSQGEEHTPDYYVKGYKDILKNKFTPSVPECSDFESGNYDGTYLYRFGGEKKLEPSGYFDPRIYYIESFNNGGQEHAIQDFTKSDGAYHPGTVGEISFECSYEQLSKLGLDKLYLMGIRVYYNSVCGRLENGADKNFEEAPEFREYINTPISEMFVNRNAISEIAIFFRYYNKDSYTDINNRRLFKYVFSLEKYQTVIKNSQQGEAVYFIPFIADLRKETGKKIYQLYEGWYGTVKNGKYVPGEFKSKDDSEPVFYRPYFQLGYWRGDIYNINNYGSSSHPDLLDYGYSDGVGGYDGGSSEIVYSDKDDSHNHFVSAYVAPGFDFEFDFKDPNKIDKLPPTAESLKNVVIGCFTKNKPDFNSVPDGWAYSVNTGAKDVTIKGIDDYYRNTVKILDNEKEIEFGKIDLSDFINKFSVRMLNFKVKRDDGTYEILEEGKRITDAYKVILSYKRPGDILYTSTLESCGDLKWAYTVNDKNEATSIGIYSQLTKYAASFKRKVSTRGEIGSSLSFEKCSSENLIKNTRNYIEGAIENDKCYLYVNKFGKLCYGIGFSYTICNNLGDDSNIRKQFNNFIEKAGKNLFNIKGEYYVIDNPPFTEEDYNKSKKDIDSKVSNAVLKEGLKKLGTTTWRINPTKGYYVFKPTSDPEAYRTDIKELDEPIKKIYERNCSKDVINWLKIWAVALDGYEGKKSEAQKRYGNDISMLENSQVSRLDQISYESLLLLDYSSNSDLNNFCRAVTSKIMELVKKNRGLTEKEKQTKLIDAIKYCLNEVKKASNTKSGTLYFQNQFIANYFVCEPNNKWVIREEGEKECYDKDKDTLIVPEEKLKFEINCVSITGGLIESSMGAGGFNRLNKK